MRTKLLVFASVSSLAAQAADSTREKKWAEASLAAVLHASKLAFFGIANRARSGWQLPLPFLNGQAAVLLGRVRDDLDKTQ